MKLLFLLLLSITAVFGYSQSNVDLRGDSVRIYKNGGHAELVLRNKTKDTLGFLYNKGNGVTEFRTVSSLGAAFIHGTKGNILYYAPDGSGYTVPITNDSANSQFTFGRRVNIPVTASGTAILIPMTAGSADTALNIQGSVSGAVTVPVNVASNAIGGISNWYISSSTLTAGSPSNVHYHSAKYGEAGMWTRLGGEGSTDSWFTGVKNQGTSAAPHGTYLVGAYDQFGTGVYSAMQKPIITDSLGNVFLIPGISPVPLDTTTYKLMVRDGTGLLRAMNWPGLTGGGGSIPPNRGTGLRIYSPQIPALNSIFPIYPLKGDSTTTTGNLTLYWDSSKSTIARGGVHFNLGLTAIPDTLRLGGIFDSDTHLSGSSLYNLYLDSGNFKISGANTLAPFPLDSTNFKIIVRRPSDSALYEMSWPTFGAGGSGMAIGSPVTNGGKQMSVFFGGTGGILEQDSVHFRYDSTFQILTIAGLKLGQNSIYQISTKDGNAVNIGNDLTGSSDNTRNLGTAAIKWKSTATYGLLTGYVAKTGNYTLTISDNVVDFTSGTSTATLPTAASITGTQYTIKNTGTGVTTVATTSSQTIDGSTVYTLPFQYAFVTLQSNGSNWLIVNTNVFQTPTTVTTVYSAYGAVNNGASTAGNPQYGGAYYSQGSAFVSSTSTEGGFKWFNKPLAVSTQVRNRLTFQTNQGGAPYADIAYISDELTGGIFHANLGDFTNVNLAYQEVSGATDYATSPSSYTVCTSGTFTVTLRQAAQSLGSQFNETTITNIGSGTITVKGNGSENITEGATTSNTFTLAQGKMLKVHINAAGTAWYVVDNN